MKEDLKKLRDMDKDGVNSQANIVKSVDDYSRYTWTLFLRTKNDAFCKLARVVQNEKGLNIILIRSLNQVKSVRFNWSMFSFFSK